MGILSKLFKPSKKTVQARRAWRKYERGDRKLRGKIKAFGKSKKVFY